MLIEKSHRNGVVFHIAPKFAAAGIPHAFSTRIGGVSTGAFDSLNFGNPHPCEAPDPPANLARNHALLAEAVGVVGRERIAVHQVHGVEVVTVRHGDWQDPATRADALVSDDAERLLSIRTADCVPILLAGADGRWVAAVHAGWRGVVGGVVLAAVKAMARLSGRGTETWLAAVGPCIGFDAFEVGPEVAAAFERCFGGTAPIRAGRGDRAHVDLRAAVAIQLRAAGVEAANIAVSDRCTHRDATEFFSHRRNGGLMGRHVAVIGAVE